MSTTYAEQLKDPRWQRRRLEILSRANFACEECKDSDRTLHVHHRLYRKGCKPWEYADCELVALCEDCHKEEHEIRERLKDAVASMDSHDLLHLLGYAEAMVAVRLSYDPSSSARTSWPIFSLSHAGGFAARLTRNIIQDEDVDYINRADVMTVDHALHLLLDRKHRA